MNSNICSIIMGINIVNKHMSLVFKTEIISLVLCVEFVVIS